MRSIWAVAVNTIKQALRLKIALIFILLLLVLLPTMALTTTGDNTLKGKLQTFISYGLSLTSLLLCLLTVIVAAFTLSSDLKHKQIYTVITKSIRRSQFILGKLLGVLLLSVSLLALFSGLIYAIVIYAPHYLKPSSADLTQARNEFYTARESVAPPEPDVSKEVAEAHEKLVKGGDIDQIYAGMSSKQIDEQLTNLRKVARRTADVGRELLWEFDNVRPTDPNGSIFIRFKYDVAVTPPDSQIYSRWAVGDYRRYVEGAAPLYNFLRKNTVKAFHELEVPADAVAEDGYLAVVFLNDPLNSTSVTFPLEDGIKVLYPADTFTANFARATLLILCRIVFLACLGIFAATFLSFPVAILVCMVIFSAATVSAFVIDSFYYISSENVAIFYTYTIKLLVSLLPQFDKFSPSIYLIPAELISWSAVGRALLYTVCIKSLLLLVLGLIIFSFRELARIIV